ncbi:MAG TPA: TonB-dependent receptor [Candidatus Binatia bacterium]|jgi:outer membrane receptor for ferrienterochelin and colicins|nr:TonB-dependent receptor [Candidatus Binatia bacterium]
MRRAFPILALSLALGVASAESDPAPKAVDLTELPLEALMNLDVPKVYGASKLEQKTTEAPSSITIITADEIKKFGYRTLADVLQSVQGFNVSYDRNYAFLGARGVSLGDFNSRILLLVNGHRVNNNLTDGAFIDTAFILDIDLVDRVEIIRGPGSVLYGNNAFFGVINVITRQGKQLNGVETSGEYGSFETYKTRLTYGQLFTNGVQVMLSGTYYDSSGQDRLFYKEFNTPAQNNGVAQNMDGDWFGSFFGSLGYEDFTLEGGFNHREKVNPTAQFDLTTFNDPRLQTTDERSYAALKYAHSFPDVVDLTAQVYYDGYTHGIGYPQSLLVGTNVLFSAFTTEHDLGEWWGAELQLNKRLWERHVLTLGGEYRDDFRQEQNISGQQPVSRTRESHGVYFQGDFALLTNLHFVGGVRYDQYGDFDPSFDPRLALIYHPLETSTLKAIYGTAFRAPNFDELSDPRFQNIKPEEITAYELVYEQEIGRYLRSSLSGFYNDMHDLIVFDSGSFTNFDAQTKGVELALEGSWPGGIRGRASYSLQDTRNTSVAWEMPDSPNHLVKLNLSVPLWKDKIFAGAEFRFASNRRTLHNTTDSSGQPLTVQGEDAASYGIVNLTLFSQNIVKNLEFSASIYNLLDRRYDDPASRFHVQDLIQQDGRTFRLKLTYHF